MKRQIHNPPVLYGEKGGAENLKRHCEKHGMYGLTVETWAPWGVREHHMWRVVKPDGNTLRFGEIPGGTEWMDWRQDEDSDDD